MRRYCWFFWMRTTYRYLCMGWWKVCYCLSYLLLFSTFRLLKTNVCLTIPCHNFVSAIEVESIWDSRNNVSKTAMMASYVNKLFSHGNGPIKSKLQHPPLTTSGQTSGICMTTFCDRELGNLTFDLAGWGKLNRQCKVSKWNDFFSFSGAEVAYSYKAVFGRYGRVKRKRCSN